MEDFLLFVLLIAVVAVLVRQRHLSQRLHSLEELYQRLARTEPAPLQPQAVPRATPSTPYVVPQPVAQHQAPPPTAPLRPTPFPPPQPPAPARATPLPPAPLPPAPTPKPAPAAREHISLEARLGQNWLNKLGIAALVIGLALGLGKVITTLGPLGKDAIGFALALGILGLGLWLERKPDYRIFARACIGGGWALTFFLSYAIYNIYALQVLTSEAADLVLMLLVAAAMVVHSLRYRSQTVTAIAYLLAFITVGISNVTVFSLVAGALLAGSLAFIVARERWYELGLAGLIGVYLNHYLWLQHVLPGGGIPGYPFADYVPSAALLLAYWLIFRLVYVFRQPLEGSAHDRQQLVSTLTAILNSVGLLGLLKYQSSHPEWAFRGLLVLGIAELGLSLFGRATVDGKPKNRAAFITLSSIAAVLLLAAVPFRFHGASWALLWLLEAEVFFVVGIRLPEIVFRRIGILANALTAVLMLVNASEILTANASVITLPATPRHPALVLFTAALVLWLNAELATRLARFITEHEFDRVALRLTSYIAALPAALGFAVALCPPHAWNSSTAFLSVAWIVLALILAGISDKLNSRDLATQSDILAIAAIIRTLSVNLGLDATPYSLPVIHLFVPLRAITLALTAALLYLAMRRKTAAYILPARFIAPAYTWAAGTFVALLCWYQLEPISVAVAWGVFALVLFELGVLFRRNYLRQQAYVLLAASFVRIFFANMHVAAPSGGLSPSLYTVVPLIAAFAWVYERVHANSTATRLDNFAGSLAAWFGVVAATALLYFEVRPDWVILAWTLLAIALLALAAALKRPIFIAQSLALVAAVALRGIFFHLFSTPALAATFTTSRVFTIGLTCSLLLLALQIAFYLRRYYLNANCHPEERSDEVPASPVRHRILSLLYHPEQPIFFVPLALLTLLLFVQFSGGLITIGWVTLGLATFLFALTVKERSYRLSGLGLLLLGVVKVLLWDVWHASPSERYLTLIIMGAALLLVSFLYSRYRETLLKFL